MLPELERYPFEPGSLTDAARVPQVTGRYPQYRQGLDWIRDFVARPDTRLRRAGPVCPRVAAAVRRNYLWFVTVRTEGWSSSEAAEKGLHLIGLYRALLNDPDAFRLGALLCFFPDVPAEHAGQFIDGGHCALRPGFVRSGLMLGEFHPASEVGSVHNPSFKVMRSPTPMFAVRALSAHDLMFLDTPATPRDLRLEYLRLYLRYTAGQHEDRAGVQRARSSIRALEGAPPQGGR